MPHQCTDCGRVFDDGSTEMLSGCPGCSGTTFQYHPDGADVPDQPTAEPPDRPERPGEGSVAQKVGSAATTVRDLVGSSPSPSASGASPSQQRSASATTGESATPETTEVADAATVDGGSADAEDAAQASARSELISPDELPEAPETTTSPRPTSVLDEPTDRDPGDPRPREDRPDLRELRAELNDQFESIKVVEPGQYELNLMSLYDREEYIIALQEDGKYTIQVPERWEDD